MNKYFKLTRRFSYSLLLILPLLVVYEIGLWQNVLDGKANGADVILRYFFIFLFQVLGIQLTKWILAGIIILGIVLLLYYFKSHRLKVRFDYLLLMVLESAIIAFGLSIIIQIIISYQLPSFFTFKPNPSVVQQIKFLSLDTIWAKIVAAIGAGIFEELVFRVILISSLLKIFGIRSYYSHRSNELIKIILISSFVFTILHVGSISSLWGYVTVFISAIFLALIYIWRGYGVVAVTHIFYDLFLMFGVIS